MRISYDQQYDLAHIYFVPTVAPGSIKETQALDPILLGGMINLDYDGDGRLVSIEVIGAKRRFSRDILTEARRELGGDARVLFDRSLDRVRILFSPFDTQVEPFIFVCTPKPVTLRLSRDGRLLEVEVEEASRYLPPLLLDEATND